LIFDLDFRPSDSPFVDQVWRARSVNSGTFNSVSVVQWEMVVTHRNGRTTFTVRGPQTRSAPLACLPDGDWVGIRFKIGTFMPRILPGSLVNKDLNLPNAGDRSFWLDSSAWQFPDYENADTFIDRLAGLGLIARDPVVDLAVQGEVEDLSPRSLQRRFLQTTGLTQSTIRQIDRAKSAMEKLQEGFPILDVVHEFGYYDQPHLTRSLKRWLGETPTQIAGLSQFDWVSF
jgi:AraC-like DNA-binding protein